MEDIFLSMRDGNTGEIQQIKYKDQCPRCLHPKIKDGRTVDGNHNIMQFTCSNLKCGQTYSMPLDDWNSVPTPVDHEV